MTSWRPAPLQSRDDASVALLHKGYAFPIGSDGTLPRDEAPLSAEIEAYTFGKYRIKMVPGTVPAALISLAGVGNPSGDDASGVDMRFEWEGTLRRLHRQEHLIFVQDTGRSWFNDTTGWEGFVACIR
jgi:hypothetical protein